MAIEFRCEGCGSEVITFGAERVPEDGFCGICEWLNENVEPANIITMKRLLIGKPAQLQEGAHG